MLEQKALHLRQWHPPDLGGSAEAIRAIVNEGGITVGFVRKPLSGSRWWRWLHQPVFEVFEEPDASLVFVLRRCWGWPAYWDVSDADGRLVGSLRRGAMFDGFGHFLAVIAPRHPDGRGTFVATDGRELGEFSQVNQDMRVVFGQALEGNPFAKMLLLGALLII